jgi:hypothetical protein
VVGTAVLHQSKGEPIYRSNIAWIDGAPPELGIPAPDQPL